MTWLIISASVVGTSHKAVGADCQDSCFAQVETYPSSKSPLLMIFVTDGAGSAPHGGIGAELAIEAAVAFFGERYAREGDGAISVDLAKECIQAVRTKIDEEAKRKGAKARDYACTFLGVVASQSATLLMQIGDGGIVVDIGNGLEAPIKPMTGEYANMTNFVTDENAIDVLEAKVFPSRPEKAAVFSDGIQRLAMKMVDNTPHEPFFTNFFAVLAKATLAQQDQLQIELERFLNSPAVNERTDDDKTLALAFWIGDDNDDEDFRHRNG